MARVERFTVILEEQIRGAAVGSTEDLIEALDAEAAQKAWKTVQPHRSFVPLLIVEARP